ncbi:MAG TPA: adenylate cyclase regulatory domain-containing protein [Solirubrobacteraceae bacterium]|nr:adenylate cyclase regulatory domain-containing protein [Solirubrobacteraceae bacterium]
MDPEPIDFAAEGLLEGLEGEQRADRQRLLEYLAADGVALAELKRAAATGTLMFLPAERVIGGRARYTAAQAAELTGVELERLSAMRRAMGLPVPADEEAVYTEEDIAAIRTGEIARLAGVSDAEVLELMRTLGRGLAPAAEVMRTIAMQLVIEPGVSEYELARRYADAAAQLSPTVGPLVTNLLTAQLRQMAQNEVITAAERSGGQLPGSREVAICFADLVGFTRLGELVAPQDLGRLATRLEAITVEVLEAPVRLIKTIGDAVMLASPEPAPLLDAGLALLDAADEAGEDFPQLRIGSALGPALSRAGDWFGRPVNIASRITQIAHPGSLLAEREVREAVPDGYRWSYAGERRLRGVRVPVPLFRARRLQA